ncbi:aspartyl/asparaginyl beta-hydroxylase domain-containing protein [Iamia majanohamensis]|uniref:Aspartyl/asparaginyl beta-hydroxylase domain-containing protein n=1 Tax=Iamia majanohamensis TaxID=467976 RepID=A0AAE9Y479_9ACTN|nr:aspartyl/asparaginyl beta-hydroxylase domain-containing protein [Iamia majanohamensis]WCO65877.1 aspartyl/asparaginyl beta-hydroxylase domain-containing protein [Iamia majanohamensis]
MVRAEAKPSEVDPRPEPIWYFRSLALYKGKYPAYYDVSELPGTKVLEDNYEAIRDEILTFYRGHAERISPNNIPYTYEDPGWRTHTLYAFGLRHEDNCADLPFLDSVVSQIPDMVTATVSILEPHTRIHAHVGASSGVIRTHLGISVPGAYPEVGIRVRGHGRGWEEGKLFGIEMAHRHLAWNTTDQFRIALTVDTIKPEYADRKADICGRCLALLAMQTITTKVPLTKRLPRPVVGLVHTGASLAVRAVISGQRAYLRARRPAPAPSRRPDLAEAS